MLRIPEGLPRHTVDGYTRRPIVARESVVNSYTRVLPPPLSPSPSHSLSLFLLTLSFTLCLTLPLSYSLSPSTSLTLTLPLSLPLSLCHSLCRSAVRVRVKATKEDWTTFGVAVVSLRSTGRGSEVEHSPRTLSLA